MSLLVLFLALALGVGAQGGSPVFPEARLEELREEIVYEPPERPEPREVEEDFSWEFDLENASPLVLGGILLLLLLVLGFLIYRILGDFSLGKTGRARTGKESRSVSLDEVVEEQLIVGGGSATLLERAEASGQYDLAVRLLYIGLLKSLNDAQLIRYRRDFSNYDYRRQIGNSPIRDDFRDATDLYERYWYGKYPIDRLSYRLTSKKFAAVTNALPATDLNPAEREG